MSLSAEVNFLDRNIVKTVEVKRRSEVSDRSPDYVPLWIIVTMSHGYNFENWLDWPQCEDNWPNTFDKVSREGKRVNFNTSQSIFYDNRTRIPGSNLEDPVTFIIKRNLF